MYSGFGLIELFKHAVKSSSGIIAYPEGDLSQSEWLSYAELWQRSADNAGLLRHINGFYPGRIILIHFRNHLDNMVWFWAALLAGAIPAMSTPFVNNHDGRRAHIMHLHNLLENPLCITRQESIESDFFDNGVLQVVAVESVLKLRGQVSTTRDWTRHGPPDDTAALMLTSGSTGNAKAVRLTHSQILTSVAAKTATLPLTSAALNWIGLDHVAGLVEIHINAMYAGVDQVHVQAADMLTSPLAFLRLLSKHAISRTFAPNFFLVRLRQAMSKGVGDVDLRSLRYIVSGGEANTVEVCQAMSKLLEPFGAPRNVIVPGFGMTETCAGAIYHKQCPEYDNDLGCEFTLLGKCVPGIEMRVSSPEDQSETSRTSQVKSLPSQGMLELRGPIVFQDYFNNPKASLEAFTDDGWFKTGDLARIDDHGNLQLLGRTKEVLTINGVKYLPHEIEAALEDAEIPGITPSFIACFSLRPKNVETEQSCVVYQHQYTEKDDDARMNVLSAILRVFVSFTGSRPYVLPVRKGILEKTTLGKLSRAKIAKALSSGEYKAEEDLNEESLERYRGTHHVNASTETEKRLLSLVEDTLNIDKSELGIETPILEVGVTSVDLIRLKSRIEECFSLAEIPLIIIMTNTTVEALAKIIEQMGQSQRNIAYSPVVTLQRNGEKVPLWLIHPGIGEILVFLGLAKYLNDRPVHAMRARGFNGGEALFQDLNDVVNSYYTALKATQPSGPYAIAGYSYGSMIAFEIAKRLESNGDEVRFLGSFNLPPHIKDRMKHLDWTAGLLHIAFFCQIISEEKSEEMVQELRKLPHDEAISTLLAVSNPDRVAELGLTHGSLATWIDVSYSLQRLGAEYEPSGLVTKMDVFFCDPLKVVASSREEYYTEHLQRWTDFCRQQPQFHPVAGSHYTMLSPENIQGFQSELKRVLQLRGV